MIYWELFIAFVKIGAFSFGGGYASMALIQAQVIDQYHWLSTNEFTNLVTISQMTPGPIAINAATFVGQQVAGTLGAIAATLGCILPSLIVVLILAMFYVKYRNLSIMQTVLAYLKPCVIAMILGSGIELSINVLFGQSILDLMHVNWMMMVLFISSFIYLYTHPKANPIVIMLLSGVIYTIFSLVC